MNQKLRKTFKILCTIWSFLTISTCGAYEYECNTNDSCCDKGITIQADLLVWTAYQTNFDYCIVGNLDGFDLTDGCRRYLEYDWDTGFRIGAGYRIPCSCLGIRGVYTSFHTNASDSVKYDTATFPWGNPVILPILVPTGFSDNPTDSAKATIDTDYDTFDILLSYQNCSCSCIDFAPYVGVRGLYLKQDHKVILGAGTENGNTVWVEGDGTRWKSDYKGFGIHIGIDNSYNICRDFNLFGNLSGAWLIGCYDGRESFTTSGDFSRERDDIRDKDVWQGVADTHAAIGLSWEPCICGINASLSIGYEVEFLWGVPELRRQTGVDANAASCCSTSGGTLTFHGGFFRAGVSF